MPVRIQRRRTKGWRMPEGAIYVGRPTRWGNPFRTGPRDEGGMTAEQAVNAYRYTVRDPITQAVIRKDLARRNLACWCPLDQPCHADVLLELANA